MDRIGLDKVLHFAVGMVIAIVAMMGVYYLTNDRLASQLAGFLVAMAVGVGKELYDRKRTGFDWQDLLADGVGAVVGVMMGFFI